MLHLWDAQSGFDTTCVFTPLLLKQTSRENCKGLNGKHPHVVYLISWLWQEIFTAQCNLEYKIQIRDPMSKYLPEMLHAILVCRCRSCAWDLKSPLYLEHLTTTSSSEDSDWQILNIALWHKGWHFKKSYQKMFNFENWFLCEFSSNTWFFGWGSLHTPKIGKREKEFTNINLRGCKTQKTWRGGFSQTKQVSKFSFL